MTTPPNSKILWQQLIGLALLQLAVGWSWQIYSAAQPVILHNFNLVAVAGILTLMPGLLSLLLDPLIGRLSDQIQAKLGSRLPALNVGVVLTSLIFLTVAFSIQTAWLMAFNWLIPFFMIAWVATMKIFQNPSIALAKRYATPKELPQAVAVLTFVWALTNITKPFMRILVEQWGGSLPFLLGAVILIIAMTVMQRLTPKTSKPITDNFEKPAPSPILIRLFIMGICLQLAMSIGSAVIPLTLAQHQLYVGSEAMGSLIAVISGLTAIPLGNWLKRITLGRTLSIGLGGMLGLLSLTLLNLNSGLIAVIAVGFALNSNLLYNVSVPFVFEYVPAPQASWGLGLFFGGGGAASAMIAALKLIYGDIPVMVGWFMVLGALIMARVCWVGLVAAKN